MIDREEHSKNEKDTERPRNKKRIKTIETNIVNHMNKNQDNNSETSYNRYEEQIEADNDEERNEIDHSRERERQLMIHEEIEKGAYNENWIGSSMERKSDQTGLRIGTNNFQRKLYGSKQNTIEMIKAMKEHELNIMMATEPGPGTRTNTTIFKNTIKEYGMGAITINRDETTIGGGIAMIMDEAWAKIPAKIKAYEPTKREMKGRAMAVTFDNRVPGMHNKLMIIGIHANNNADKEEEDTTKLLQWIQRQKTEFNQENPLATTIILGDLNAAGNTHLETDRQQKEDREIDKEEEEKDAFVIDEIRKMKMVDIFRGRYPTTRAVTRISKQTNRMLDRIMVSTEAASHPATEIAIYKHQIITAGSDHRMVVADLPIDTAGMAKDRVPLWKKTTITKWVRDIDELGRTEQGKIEEFNLRLRTTEAEVGFQGYTKWIREAAEGTILRKVTKTYPKRVNLRCLYTPEDHKMRANLRTLRHIRQRVADGEDARRTRIIAKRRLKVVEGSMMTTKVIENIIKECKRRKEEMGKGEKIEGTIKEIEEHLSKKNRNDRSKQIRESIKRRDRRFQDKGKLMLKLVINSLMRRHRESEEITVVEGRAQRAYEEGEVSKVVKDFYQEWMETRVKVEDRFENWEAMINVEVAKVVNPEHREFVEQTYGGSRQKFKKLQDEQGIWNGVRKDTSREEVKEALKSMKKGTAPGPSGISYDTLGMMEEEHLDPLVRIINEAIQTGKVEREMNRSLLRPLAKTDQGLADLNKTRPIALMESILKITKRIIFGRVMEVIKEHDMLRSEQHGSLRKRSVKAPIRALTEMIEDAIVTGQELHILSADIAKAFDSMEYWSHALGWAALGMPRELIEMIVGMDREGETAIILGQGRNAEWYKNGRGVRQGSIGGPIKWVVFINFWIEYVYNMAKGDGYRMSEAEDGTRKPWDRYTWMTAIGLQRTAKQWKN